MEENTDIPEDEHQEIDEETIQEEIAEEPADVIASLEAALQESKNETLRLHAEFENFQKRTLKEKNAAVSYAHESIAKDLLAVVDTFEQALISMEDGDDEKVASIKEGVELTFEQLKKALEKNHIKEVETKDGYDPNFHQAIMQVDSEDHETGEIVAVLQKGYQLKERILRPAMVSTCK